MMWQRTSLKASDLPTSLTGLRQMVERTVPTGFNDHGDHLPGLIQNRWQRHLLAEYEDIITRYPGTRVREAMKPIRQLGTLGGGNHFIEIVTDEHDHVGIMLHSGSRGGGNVVTGQALLEGP